MLTWLVLAMFAAIVAGFMFIFLGKLGDGDIGSGYSMEKVKPGERKQAPGSINRKPEN